ncbi:hypothetical protein K432DRAFT_400335 [Lepidopterella palustris CBS 459.81]|uniref:Uncharacterized protein n=1 Tax=Lepidopterella palustris CBS 459.81 TaxID=1314670 RepID=A0A8E2EKV8_9PEZI|nr:hypothetical protein K432DRAFT_400335 [Lepidopterella palustris CBS 459.81]
MFRDADAEVIERFPRLREEVALQAEEHKPEPTTPNPEKPIEPNRLYRFMPPPSTAADRNIGFIGAQVINSLIQRRLHSESACPIP